MLSKEQIVSTSAKQLLAEHNCLRQFKHNDGSGQYVFAYDKYNTEMFVRELIAMLLEAQKSALDNAEDAARMDWLASRKKLSLHSDNSTWTRCDGSKFVNSHRLAEGDHMHGTGECLRDIIDAAMEEAQNNR